MFDLERFELSLFEASAGRAAALMRLLGNERRLMILCQLLEGELSVGELQPRIGLSQSALSQHLAILREEGAVATRRDGQIIYYRVADPAVLRVLETLARANRDLAHGQRRPAAIGLANRCLLRRHRQQALDGVSRAVHGPGLDRLGDGVQRHHHRGFRPLADREGARHGHGHQRGGNDRHHGFALLNSRRHKNPPSASARSGVSHNARVCFFSGGFIRMKSP